MDSLAHHPLQWTSVDLKSHNFICFHKRFSPEILHRSSPSASVLTDIQSQQGAAAPQLQIKQSILDQTERWGRGPITHPANLHSGGCCAASLPQSAVFWALTCILVYLPHAVTSDLSPSCVVWWFCRDQSWTRWLETSWHPVSSILAVCWDLLQEHPCLSVCLSNLAQSLVKVGKGHWWTLVETEAWFLAV